MSIYRVFRRSISISPILGVTRYTLRLRRCEGKNVNVKNCVTDTKAKFNKKESWYSFVRRWELTLPAGIGVSLLAVLQWRHLRRHPYPRSDDGTQEPVNDFIVTCYCCLPLRITSRIWGWIASIELPMSLRPTLYGFYARLFHANLDEIDVDLSIFPSLVEFFVRPLKSDARPIAQNTNIVSPADGTILHFGKVSSCCVEQVKGVTYNLRNFLGHLDEKPILSDCDYVKSLLSNPLNELYQIIIYLAPGDYHRFHSPADWKIELRKHFQGKLLSVNPRIASFIPDLFSLNERVVYIGKWLGGFMAYAAVGATNVGSIRVYFDKDLSTNTIKWPLAKHWEDEKLASPEVRKGDLFGEFRMGSTIVLLFEAPADFQFCLQPGQQIKVGQALTNCMVKDV
ncbi:phosphatidylserine decarboxylase proenzyme, mitochondrial isoform X2 [Prorops nasuta]|uniref:phosphatidylserine decarboxylase proenzyme, mitochondrial isoform X2 n=1 Tax=Prorops nasuta TaxID=863751 RepID=UPI0034CE22B2